MLFNTPTQFAVLALCLLAGWIFGLASAPGGKKWKLRLREAELEHKRFQDEVKAERKDRDARIAELERDRDAAMKARNVAAPAVIGTAAAVGATTTDSTAPRRGWFGWGRDNLSRIRGIDAATEKSLNDAGIKAYADIEAMSDTDAAALEDRIGVARGTIASQQWREQAALLTSGDEDDHASRFA